MYAKVLRKFTKMRIKVMYSLADWLISNGYALQDKAILLELDLE